MTLAVTHRDKNGNVILDCLRERRPPFSPEAVVTEFAAVCKAYGITKIVGDHWGGEFVARAVPQARHHLRAGRPAEDRDFYSEFSDHQFRPRRTARSSEVHISLCALERRTARSGKKLIDHPPGGHDDLVNVVALALVLAARKTASMILTDKALRSSHPTTTTVSQISARRP